MPDTAGCVTDSEPGRGVDATETLAGVVWRPNAPDPTQVEECVHASLVAAYRICRDPVVGRGDNEAVLCACESLFELNGNEAVAYAREHLEELEVDVVQWLIKYRCPVTGRPWLRDSPRSELHGGGPPRLRQLDLNGEPLDASQSRDPFR
jgi:hypothetical protein